MRFLIIFVAVFACDAAHADCLKWGRDQRGARVCMMDDALNRNPVIPEDNSITGSGSGVTVTSTPMPKCEDGWSVVLSTGMQPMCARELKKPQ